MKNIKTTRISVLVILAILFIGFISTMTNVSGEQSVGSISKITFNQINYNIDGNYTNNSRGGTATVEYKLGDEIYYFNLVINDKWVCQNMPVMPVGNKFVFDFDLGVDNGTDLILIQYAYNFTKYVLKEKPTEQQNDTVTDVNVVLYRGERIDAVLVFLYPPLFIAGQVEDSAWHDEDDIVNQPCGLSECVPAAISNSLQFLNNKHDLGMHDGDIDIDTMKKATDWDGGSPFGWWDDKKDYMKDNNYPITTTIYDETVDMDDIIDEIRDGQDIELRVQGHAAQIVGIAKLTNGKYILAIAHDTEQGAAGGEQIQYVTYDPNTGLCTNGKWIDGKALSRIVVECPKEEKPDNGICFTPGFDLPLILITICLILIYYRRS